MASWGPYSGFWWLRRVWAGGQVGESLPGRRLQAPRFGGVISMRG